jgi:hypothetical protein
VLVVRSRVWLLYGLVDDLRVDPRGDEDGGDSQSEALEIEVGSIRVESIRVGHSAHGRRDVIVVSSVLVVGEEEGGRLPEWRVANGLINVLHQLLSSGDGVGWVLVICKDVSKTEESRGQEGEGGQGAGVGVQGEFVHKMKAVPEFGASSVLEEERIGHLSEISSPVVASFVQELVKGLLRVTNDDIDDVVVSLSVRSSAVEVETVHIGGAWH